MFFAASALRCARFLTSSATTENPLPWSPARAASTAALSARIFVWNAIPSIREIISVICCAHSVMDCILLATCSISSPPLRACNVATFACSLARRVLSALFRVLAAICSILAAVCTREADCCSVFTESWALRAESWSDKVMAFWDDALISRTSVAMLLERLLIPGINRPAQLLPNSGIETPRLPAVTSSILFFTVLIGVTRNFVI